MPASGRNEVGMPAKSGVSGCIMAVIPGQVGIGVYSPPLDAQGNSVRGIRSARTFPTNSSLHAFNNRTNVRSVIRRVYRGDRGSLEPLAARPRSATCSTWKAPRAP